MTSPAFDWGSSPATADPTANTPFTSSLPNGITPDNNEQRQTASSPAQLTLQQKRPLSPSSAATTSQDFKRARAGPQPAPCLHCSCTSHRWTACFSRCNHCGDRHLGKRCPSLSVDAYKPGGFIVNERFQAGAEVSPAVHLTPVVGAVPWYTVKQEEGVETGPPDMAHIAPAPTAGRVSVDGGPRGVVQSVEKSFVAPQTNGSNAMTGGMTKYSRDDLMAVRDAVTFEPAAPTPYHPAARTTNGTSAFGGLPTTSYATNATPRFATSSHFDSHTINTDNNKMDAGRAALIAVTSDQDFNPTGGVTPVGEGVGLGPKTSGMNSMPLGRKRTGMSASAPIKAEPGSGMMNPKWASQGSNVPRGQGHGQRDVDMTTGRLSPPNTGTSFDGGNQAVNQSMIGNGSAYATAANTAASINASHMAAHSTVAADDDAKKDKKAWSRLVSQINNAIRDTARPGKPFNGTNSNKAKVARTKQALDILKPMILGSQPDGTKVEPRAVGQSGAQAQVQLGALGPMSVSQTGGMTFSFGNQGASAQPPGFVWNAAAGAWQLVFPS